MPVVNPLAREIVFKLVYYGPGLGGKTTSLQHIHTTSKPEHRGKMVSLATPVDRTLYFDFLPIRVPNVRGMGVRLQLFTVPGQVYYNATRKLVLTGADAVVMVLDSQRVRMDANLESLDNLRDNLREHGRSLTEIPHVFQYNKRDLADTVSLEELEQSFNELAVPAFDSVATVGTGVYEALEAVTRLVLEDFERRIPPQPGKAPQQLELPEGGLVAALRQSESEGAPSVPHPEPMPRAVSVPAEESPEPPPTVASQPVAEAAAEPALGAVPDYAEPKPEPAAAGATPLAAPLAPEPRAGAAPGQPVQAAAAQSGAEPLDGGWPAPTSAPPPAPSSEPAVARPEPAPEPAARLEPEDASATLTLAEQRPDQAGPALPPTVSFTALWPEAERGYVAELEEAVAVGDYERAVLRADQLVARALAAVAGRIGATSDTPRDPAVVALLLGLDGRRYLEFRSLVRAMRSGGGVAQEAALSAYAFAIETRLARLRLGS